MRLMDGVASWSPQTWAAVIAAAAVVAAAVTTAVLNYVAGLRRDRTVEERQREGERRHAVQEAAVDLIEAGLDMVSALSAQYHYEAEVERLKRTKDLRSAQEARVLEQSIPEQLRLNTDQAAAANRKMNRVVIEFRLLAPGLVIPARELQDLALSSDNAAKQKDRLTVYDEASDIFARRVQAHLEKF